MAAVGRGDEATPDLRLQPVFAHQAADLLMVYDEALLPKRRANTAVAVELEVVTDRKHGFHDRGVVGMPVGQVVVGRARQTHQPASLGDGEAAGPVTTDILPLFGGCALFRAPFRNSSSRACLPTSRSRAAMRASYSCRRLAAPMSSSRAPSSYFLTQMRIR